MHPADVPPQHGKGRRARPVRDDPVSRGRAGEQRRRGSVAGPGGPFALAAGLIAPGALPLADAIDMVCADLDRQATDRTISPATAYNAGLAARRFGVYAGRYGATTLASVDQELCELYIHSPNAPGYGLIRVPGAPAPARPATGYSRRNTLRTLFKTARALGLDDRDPAADIALPARVLGQVRTATADEVERCKDASRSTLTETLLPCVLALFIAGQGTAELPYTVATDVHLDARLVWSHGGGTKAVARWVPLDDWQAEMVRRRIDWLDKHPSRGPEQGARRTLTYTPRRDGMPHAFRQASSANSVAQVLRRAGFSQVPDLGSKSLRQYVGQDIYDQTGSLAQVATRFGMVSLDAAADLIGLDWRADNALDGPPGVPTPGRDDRSGQ